MAWFKTNLLFLFSIKITTGQELFYFFLDFSVTRIFAGFSPSMPNSPRFSSHTTFTTISSRETLQISEAFLIGSITSPYEFETSSIEQWLKKYKIAENIRSAHWKNDKKLLQEKLA